MFEWTWNYEADKGGAGGSGGEGGGGNEGGEGGGEGGAGGKRGGQKPLTYEEWVKGQDESVVKMLEGHTKGLKSALDSERDGRKSLEKELRDLASKAEKDSEAAKKLEGLADEMAEADRKADFYEEAHSAGVTNLKLAYVAAVQDEMFDRRGRVNFEALKKGYPELFGEKGVPAGNAGSGSGDKSGQQSSMNDFIRAAAGRRVE